MLTPITRKVINILINIYINIRVDHRAESILTRGFYMIKGTAHWWASRTALGVYVLSNSGQST